MHTAFHQYFGSDVTSNQPCFHVCATAYLYAACVSVSPHGSTVGSPALCNYNYTAEDIPLKYSVGILDVPYPAAHIKMTYNDSLWVWMGYYWTICCFYFIYVKIKKEPWLTYLPLISLLTSYVWSHLVILSAYYRIHLKTVVVTETTCSKICEENSRFKITTKWNREMMWSPKRL